MKDYKIAHNYRELLNLASEGYVFVDVLEPNNYLMEKQPTNLREAIEELNSQSDGFTTDQSNS